MQQTFIESPSTELGVGDKAMTKPTRKQTKSSEQKNSALSILSLQSGTFRGIIMFLYPENSQ